MNRRGRLQHTAVIGDLSSAGLELHLSSVPRSQNIPRTLRTFNTSARLLARSLDLIFPRTPAVECCCLRFPLRCSASSSAYRPLKERPNIALPLNEAWKQVGVSLMDSGAWLLVGHCLTAFCVQTRRADLNPSIAIQAAMPPALRPPYAPRLQRRSNGT